MQGLVLVTAKSCNLWELVVIDSVCKQAVVYVHIVLIDFSLSLF